MEWEAYVEGVGAPPMHSQRLSVAVRFPRTTGEVEEALGVSPHVVLVGYPYYARPERIYRFSVSTTRLRRQLYRLALPSLALRAVDLGDLRAPAYLEPLAKELLRRGHRLIVLGGSQDAAQALFRALAAQEAPFTYTLIDRKLDLLDPICVEEHPYRVYHREMLLDREVEVPVWGQMLGLAWHWVSPGEEEVLHAQLRMPYLRLHELLAEPDRAEPFLRTAALISVDLGILRGAEAPAVLDPEPEGLPVEIAAKLMRFAGMGYRSDVFHLANYFPQRDTDGRTAAAAALLVWYFIEGLLNPPVDFPAPDRTNLERYVVPVPDAGVRQLTFYQHPLTGRWWLEIVREDGLGPSRLFPCTRREYEEAISGEIPRLWYLLQLAVPV
ncbi:MAG: arginase family protein [Bacteroidia bacterium]|nr:arginase family protein [Bacteroidia bacterium]MDW8088934.1 arginase family protein [Bacteroidia bacterium]